MEAVIQNGELTQQGMLLQTISTWHVQAANQGGGVGGTPPPHTPHPHPEQYSLS